MEDVTATGVRRKDTTKGPPLRILCLDGGGVRGYSTLIMLQELMYRTYVEAEGKAPRRHQIPKPCDHFDLIAGYGTGGLIALMLGRLRLDIETCKNLYPRLTKYVFETDKTIAGIPYRSTLFKASRLEDAIRQCVREHTVSEYEGNDGSPSYSSGGDYNYMGPPLTSPSTTSLAFSGGGRRLSRSNSNLSRTTSTTSVNRASLQASPPGPRRWGNPNAQLYDNRENRTKTAVTAYFRGTPKNVPPMLLRSYDSRKEPAPDFNCTVWQAGRATCAMLHHFKPIQIGQQMFLDEGGGKFNPSPQILDEATVNEWPGREVGVFISIGTGKRPSSARNIKHEWWEDVFADSLGQFAEARRNLIAKIEGCETTHKYMLKEHLAKRNVPRENYYRLNVEVGVGEYGMNEWTRLAEISTNTRLYLARSEVQRMTQDSAMKMAKIHRIHRRMQAHEAAIADAEAREANLMTRPPPPPPGSNQRPPVPTSAPPPVPQSATGRRPSSSQQFKPLPSQPIFELPAIEISADKFSSDFRPPSQHSSIGIPPAGSHSAKASSQCLPYNSSPRVSSELSAQESRPPLPPKTPLPASNYLVDDTSTVITENLVLPMPSPTQNGSRPAVASSNKWKLPYPDDVPPPPVNKSRKPTSNNARV
ncbi:hypothetical protein LOZ58_005475 [Ophidiomyces ophidiicola]|nr:hypothetical protein LOZ58_005475 [Ophidiomyces ophidiicola]